MSKTIRQFVSKISGRIMSRMSSSRRKLEVSIRVSFEPESTTGRLTLKREPLSIRGKTKDLSDSGIGFIVDSIRLKEHYLVGENRILDAELDLPNGRIKMKLIGQRYEQVGQHLSINQYLIVAVIKSMTPMDKEIYDEYLRLGNKVKKSENKVLGFGTTKG
jgi:hypothetical protein